MLRPIFTKTIGWPLYDSDNIDTLVNTMKDRKVLSICSGTGSIKEILASEGIDIVFTDIKSMHSSVFEMDAKTAVAKYKDCNVLVVCKLDSLEVWFLGIRSTHGLCA
jgi:2-polyprenyl-3-methyl-5-hydroxy-6-metoxy-1,4-benzoquinol methylase